MKTFIFNYLLIMVVTGMATVQPVQAQSLSDVAVPQWAEPYKQQQLIASNPLFVIE